MRLVSPQELHRSSQDVIDVVFLAKFVEKNSVTAVFRVGKKPDVQEFVRLRIDRGVQPVR